jgi:hypothetical protein
MAERTALSKGPRPAQAKNTPPARRSNEDRDKASVELARAMALCGFADGPHLMCPSCGTTKEGKVELRQGKAFKTRYVKCWVCKFHMNAIDLVMTYLGLTFPQAINLLNGVTQITDDPERQRQLAELAAKANKHLSESFKAELSIRTVEVYNAVLSSKYVSLEAAQKYYGQWHISPQAVVTLGFVYITEPILLARDLVQRFGSELVVLSGLAKELGPEDHDATGTKLRWMFSANYPVVEPQISPKGLCHSMQFRPSVAQKKKVLAHKTGEGKYVPQFMSLRGAGPNHLIGINLEYLCKLEPTRVDVVEGAKDVAADLTLGNAAFGMPGTGVLPPKQTVDALRRAGHTLRVCMDGDEAGIAAQDKVVDHFIANGFPPDRISKHPMPPGMDIADILVARYQRAQTK